MESKDFKKTFDIFSKIYGFEKAFGGWFKTSTECILVLDLQKSNFGNHFDLNIKIFVQGLFGNDYSKTADLVKKQIGDIFRRHPPEYNDVLDLDNTMNDDDRKRRLEASFAEFIGPFTDKALSRQGLKHLEQENKITLLPAVKKQLE